MWAQNYTAKRHSFCPEGVEQDDGEEEEMKYLLGLALLTLLVWGVVLAPPVGETPWGKVSFYWNWYHYKTVTFPHVRREKEKHPERFNWATGDYSSVCGDSALRGNHD